MLFIRFSWARSPHRSLMYLVAVASVEAGTRFLSSSSKVRPAKSLRPNICVSACDHPEPMRYSASSRKKPSRTVMRMSRVCSCASRAARSWCARVNWNQMAAAARPSAASTPIDSRARRRALHLGIGRAPVARRGAARDIGVYVWLAVEAHHRLDHRAVLAPQLQRARQLRRMHVTGGVELLQLPIEAPHRCAQILERLAGVGACLKPVAERGELLGDVVRIGLQRARRLQRDDVGAHLGGGAEGDEP